jgi:hypothetical protein
MKHCVKDNTWSENDNFTSVRQSIFQNSSDAHIQNHLNFLGCQVRVDVRVLFLNSVERYHLLEGSLLVEFLTPQETQQEAIVQSAFIL